MKFLDLIVVFFFIGLIISCKPSNKGILNNEPIDAFVQKILKDQDHQFMLEVWPTDEEIKMIFKGDKNIETLLEFSHRRKAQLVNMPETLMSLREGSSYKIESITDEEINAKNLGSFHRLNLHLIDKLQKGQKMYAIHYMKEDGSTSKFRSGIFDVNGRWVFFPYPAQAFRPSKINLDPSKMRVKRVVKE